jgi:hypothetical protein
MIFPGSGVEGNPLIPPLIALVVSTFNVPALFLLALVVGLIGGTYGIGGGAIIAPLSGGDL